jgi:hypothetical protein
MYQSRTTKGATLRTVSAKVLFLHQSYLRAWNELREILSVQRRVTASFRQRDGRTLNVRKSTVAEPDLKSLYDALALDPAPGAIRKLVA